MKNEKKLLIDLLRLEFCCTTDKSNIKIDEENIDELINFAAIHSVLPLVSDCLLSNNLLKDDSLIDYFKQVHLESIFQYQKQTSELVKISKIFSEHKIPYIPLKGAVLRHLYPEPYLRTCCDIDILVHPENLDMAVDVLKTVGYSNINKFEHDISLYSENNVHLELHFDTIVKEKNFANVRCVLSNIWDYASPNPENNYEYLLNDEMFYFYQVSHVAKHFRAAGCGVRTLLDLWILNNKVDFDCKKRISLLKQGGLLVFAEYIEKLTNIWFSDEIHDEITKKMEDYIFKSGVYGSHHNFLALRITGRFDKIINILNRFIVKYDIIKNMYPILQKHKCLTPIYQIWRWLEILFNKKRRNLTKNNIMTVINLPEEDNIKAKELMEFFEF